jgi:hypothetical protein
MTIIEFRSTIPKAKARAKTGKAQRAETSEQQSSQDKGESAKSLAHKGSRRVSQQMPWQMRYGC